jgi:hypothetical protein
MNYLISSVVSIAIIVAIAYILTLVSSLTFLTTLAVSFGVIVLTNIAAALITMMAISYAEKFNV